MSNPKEKAKELVLKYLRLQEPNYNWFHKGLAKQCALIAVEKLIDESKQLETPHRFKYWREVKNNLQKI